MAVRLLIGVFHKVDGSAIEDFEALPVGAITSTPEVVGTANCSLGIGTFAPRGQ